MPDPTNASAPATSDEKTEVLPETAVQLVEMERLKTELAGAEERAKNHWEQYLRALADVDNVRKRGAKDLESARQFAVEKFAQDLIGVKDSLELGIQNSAKGDVAALVEGQSATLRLLACLREGPDRRNQSGRAGIQPRAARSHDDAAQRCATGHRADRDPARLSVER